MISFLFARQQRERERERKCRQDVFPTKSDKGTKFSCPSNNTIVSEAEWCGYVPGVFRLLNLLSKEVTNPARGPQRSSLNPFRKPQSDEHKFVYT